MRFCASLALLIGVGACRTPRPDEPRVVDRGDAAPDASVDATARVADAGVAETPVPSPDASTAPVVVALPPETGTATFCLHVAPDQRVVQCYWTKGACDAQIAFNRESGVEGDQQCRGYAKAYCLRVGTSEQCYPTTTDCESADAKMKQRNRPTTGCSAKTQR
jgi:hypothetical protein